MFDMTYVSKLRIISAWTFSLYDGAFWVVFVCLSLSFLQSFLHSFIRFLLFLPWFVHSFAHRS